MLRWQTTTRTLSVQVVTSPVLAACLVYRRGWPHRHAFSTPQADAILTARYHRVTAARLATRA